MSNRLDIGTERVNVYNFGNIYLIRTIYFGKMINTIEDDLCNTMKKFSFCCIDLILSVLSLIFYFS